MRRAISLLICACLLLGLGACGNKGPLVLPEEDEQQQKKKSASSGS